MPIPYILLESTSSYLHVSEPMGLRGKLNLCHLQWPKHHPISRSSNRQQQYSIELTARLVLAANVEIFSLGQMDNPGG